MENSRVHYFREVLGVHYYFAPKNSKVGPQSSEVSSVPEVLWDHPESPLCFVVDQLPSEEELNLLKNIQKAVKKSVHLVMDRDFNDFTMREAFSCVVLFGGAENQKLPNHIFSTKPLSDFCDASQPSQQQNLKASLWGILKSYS